MSFHINPYNKKAPNLLSGKIFDREYNVKKPSDEKYIELVNF